MARIEKKPTGEFHSGYGCVILAAAIGVFGFIIWWAWHSLTTMDREIAAITQTQPAKQADVASQPGLAQKLTDFAKAANAGSPATLKLNADELNALIVSAPDSGNGTYAEMLRVKGFVPEKAEITTPCSLPMNTAKFWEDTKRHLVGEIDFSIELTEAGLDARVKNVRVPGKTIPDGMLKGMQMYGYLGPYQTHPEIGPVLQAIKSFTVEADGVVLSTQSAP
ncbi:MAG: hypothetical protein R3F13_21015 [Prosthecobacter sp.]